MKTEPLFLKEFICSCCSLALPCTSTTDPLLHCQQSCLWTVAHRGLLPVLCASILSKKKKKKNRSWEWKAFGLSFIQVLDAEMTRSPQICEELVIALNGILSFYLEHNEALSNNGRNKCLLIGIERRNSKKATERGVENRTKVASCQNPSIVTECALVLSVSHLGGTVLKWLSWIKNSLTVYK